MTRRPDLIGLRPFEDDTATLEDVLQAYLVERNICASGEDPGGVPEIIEAFTAIEKAFDERLEKAADNWSRLPAYCFGWLEPQGQIIKIRRGVTGYFAANRSAGQPVPVNRSEIDRVNEAIGVNRAQRAAMEAGSMFGWHTLSANPDNYDVRGEFKRSVLA